MTKLPGDPLARILTVGCISLGALGHTPLAYPAAAAIVYTVWTIVPGIPFSRLLGKLRGALLFLGLIVIANGLTESGRVLFGAGGIYLTAEGLTRGGEQALRLVIVLWGALLLASAGRMEEYQDAAERLTAAKGRPLVAAGAIAIAYLPLLVESAQRVRTARRARGEVEASAIPGGIMQIAGAALPLLASAMRNADSLAEAMESRCYSPALPRTRFRRMPVPATDVITAAAASLLTLAALTGIL